MVYLRTLLIYSALLLFPLQMQAAPDDTQLAVWANEAIVATYTYNYQNYLERQKEIAKYFTAKGWIAYSKALNASKLPDAVKKNAYYVSAVATMPPQVKNIGDNHWEATMPLLVVYKNPQYQQKQTLNVTIGFTVTPSGQGVRGLAITSLQSKVIQSPCKCPVDADMNNHSDAKKDKAS
ncbi:DotI/IcmL family type IV secretion protein [Legionella nagasakiensis]|uniref:DotI/IcmL family type IV secretion protein n=1 Tax=Legionella nagasakiensis TaxID=535290 RepID=UPI0010569BFE|nr:DotI/IcmL family type IV secretion protein [Legionella nagasakiensis]